jgi:hypothetical protein
MKKSPLVPCTACQRHVRAGESSCPFCGESGPRVAPPLRMPKGRLSSLLVMTFHAAAVTAVTGCGGQVDQPAPPTSTGGAAGHAGATGSGGSVSTGGRGIDDMGGSGGTDVAGAGGTIELGTGGDFSQGGAVPIYRATPQG